LTMKKETTKRGGRWGVTPVSAACLLGGGRITPKYRDPTTKKKSMEKEDRGGKNDPETKNGAGTKFSFLVGKRKSARSGKKKKKETVESKLVELFGKGQEGVPIVSRPEPFLKRKVPSKKASGGQPQKGRSNLGIAGGGGGVFKAVGGLWDHIRPA